MARGAPPHTTIHPPWVRPRLPGLGHLVNGLARTVPVRSALKPLTQADVGRICARSRMRSRTSTSRSRCLKRSSPRSTAGQQETPGNGPQRNEDPRSAGRVSSASSCREGVSASPRAAAVRRCRRGVLGVDEGAFVAHPGTRAKSSTARCRTRSKNATRAALGNRTQTYGLIRGGCSCRGEARCRGRTWP